VLLRDGREQLHTGTALVRFASERQLRAAVDLFSSPSARRPDGAELRVEVCDEADGSAQAAPAAPAARPGAPRLVAARLRQHQLNRRARELQAIDALLSAVELAGGDAAASAAVAMGRFPRIDWDRVPAAHDPCRSLGARRMQVGTLRGERKRATVEAFAHLLRELLPAAFTPAPGSPAQEVGTLTLIDAGCGTGNLLLPHVILSAAGARFVGVDMKVRSIELLEQ